MKHIDPVMQEVWLVKEANAKTHKNLTQYMNWLRQQGKRKHRGGRIVVIATPTTPAAQTR